jgi:hypothetical protein
MLTVELSERFFLNGTLLAPLAQIGITLTLSGVTILLIFMAVGAYAGWNQGVRAVLTITLASVIAYVTTVSGGNQVVGILNRIYSNGPRFFAFIVGNDPNLVAPLDPLISPELQVPLFFRFALFIAIVLLGWFFSSRSPWKGPATEPLARPLGLYAGAMVALLWANAAWVFYQEYLLNGGAPFEPASSVLGILPDVRTVIPSLITIFFIIIFGILFLSLPRLLAPPKK